MLHISTSYIVTSHATRYRKMKPQRRTSIDPPEGVRPPTVPESALQGEVAALRGEVARVRAQRELPSNSIPSMILIPLMPDDSYRLIDKDKMEPSILLRRLRPWRDEDADRAKPLVHAVLDKYECKAWRRDQFKWETTVYPLFYFAKDRNMPIKAVNERVFDWAGRPSDEIATLEDMGMVANTEVDLLIESANYFIFIEAKVLKKKGAKPRWRNKKEATHQLVRQFVQGRLLADQIKKEFMLATLGASDEDFIPVELRDCDRRLLDLEVVEQSGPDIHFPNVPNFSWDALSLEID